VYTRKGKYEVRPQLSEPSVEGWRPREENVIEFGAGVLGGNLPDDRLEPPTYPIAHNRLASLFCDREPEARY
jgi:hypothetical protein